MNFETYPGPKGRLKALILSPLGKGRVKSLN